MSTQQKAASTLFLTLLNPKRAFDRQLLGAWLNFANGAFDAGELVDTDGDLKAHTPFLQAVQNAEKTPPLSVPPSRPASPFPSAPGFLTEDNDGRTVTLTVGGMVPLRLDGRLRWANPTADGSAVTLVAVAYKSDAGFREWEIHAERDDECVVSIVGVSRPGPRTFRVTLRVAG
ncbi:hypothetical protein [Streptomyces sp. NBC_01244]|uniref:hypothetical protein n=1 Tax=Streptomyces sp. NBC_01244 TaxID=2903797 RepID=UPI002E0E645B|nr:hypothetical protein OG247_05460 [Streptomyces sp. NBC_01244]